MNTVPRPRTTLTAAAACGLVLSASLLTGPPVSAASPARPDPASCTTAQASLQDEFGELDLDRVRSADVDDWLARLADLSPVLHRTEREAREAAEHVTAVRAEFEQARRVADVGQARVNDAFDELDEVRATDPVDPELEAAAAAAVEVAIQELNALEDARTVVEARLEAAEAEAEAREAAFADGKDRLDAIYRGEIDSTIGDHEIDLQGLSDRLAAVEEACGDDDDAPTRPATQPRPAPAPAAAPVKGAATFTG